MQVFVIPRPLGDGTHALVRQPNRDWLPLPAEGAWVTPDEYWFRRLRDEDVIETAPPAQTDEGDGIEKTPIEMTTDASGVASADLPPPETDEPAATTRRGR